MHRGIIAELQVIQQVDHAFRHAGSGALAAQHRGIRVLLPGNGRIQLAFFFGAELNFLRLNRLIQLLFHVRIQRRLLAGCIRCAGGGYRPAAPEWKTAPADHSLRCQTLY